MENSEVTIDNVKEIIKKRYDKDTVLLIATAKDNVPSVRCVDSFYYEDSFWVVTDLSCNYVKEIQSNSNVMISDGGHNRFWCKAEITGHPLDDQNKSIRNHYLKVFHNWYKEVNNEELKSVCYIRVTPYKGYIHQDKIGYTFNFNDQVVKTGDITHHIDVKLNPFW